MGSFESIADLFGTARTDELVQAIKTLREIKRMSTENHTIKLINDFFARFPQEVSSGPKR